MIKFYHKKESSTEEMPFLLQIGRRHTLKESGSIHQDDVESPKRAYRTQSVGSFGQMTISPPEPNTRSRPSAGNLSSDDKRRIFAAASAVVITENELSSSRLYRKAKINSEDGSSTESKSTSISSDPANLEPVPMRDPRMKPVSISPRPEKISSCCWYMTVILVICLATLGIIASIGGIIYMELFAIYRGSNGNQIQVDTPTEDIPLHLPASEGRSSILQEKEGSLQFIKKIPSVLPGHIKNNEESRSETVLLSSEVIIDPGGTVISNSEEKISITDTLKTKDASLGEKEDSKGGVKLKIPKGVTIEKIAQNLFDVGEPVEDVSTKEELDQFGAEVRTDEDLSKANKENSPTEGHEQNRMYARVSLTNAEESQLSRRTGEEISLSDTWKLEQDGTGLDASKVPNDLDINTSKTFVVHEDNRSLDHLEIPTLESKDFELKALERDVSTDSISNVDKLDESVMDDDEQLVMNRPVVGFKRPMSPIEFLKEIGFDENNEVGQPSLTGKEMDIKFLVSEAVKHLRKLDTENKLISAREMTVKARPRTAFGSKNQNKDADKFERDQYLEVIRKRLYDVE